MAILLKKLEIIRKLGKGKFFYTIHVEYDLACCFFIDILYLLHITKLEKNIYFYSKIA